VFSTRWFGGSAICVMLVAVSLQVDAEQRAVKVFLHDGSFVLAQAMPEVRGDRAFLRLHPGGMLAVLPTERIDFDATARAAKPAPAEDAPDARPRNRGTVSGGGGSQPVKVSRQPEVPVLELQHPDERALEDRYSKEFSWLSERQEALEQAAGALRVREDELERELHRHLYQRRLAGALADKLRGVQEDLEGRQVELQQVGTEIQMLLNRAAARGVRIRRLPPSGDGS